MPAHILRREERNFDELGFEARKISVRALISGLRVVMLGHLALKYTPSALLVLRLLRVIPLLFMMQHTLVLLGLFCITQARSVH